MKQWWWELYIKEGSKGQDGDDFETRFNPIPNELEQAFSDWYTSSRVKSCQVSPKVGGLLWGKRPTLAYRERKLMFLK